MAENLHNEEGSNFPESTREAKFAEFKDKVNDYAQELMTIYSMVPGEKKPEELKYLSKRKDHILNWFLEEISGARATSFDKWNYLSDEFFRDNSKFPEYSDFYESHILNPTVEIINKAEGTPYKIHPHESAPVDTSKTENAKIERKPMTREELATLPEHSIIWWPRDDSPEALWEVWQTRSEQGPERGGEILLTSPVVNVERVKDVLDEYYDHLASRPNNADFATSDQEREDRFLLGYMPDPLYRKLHPNTSLRRWESAPYSVLTRAGIEKIINHDSPGRKEEVEKLSKLADWILRESASFIEEKAGKVKDSPEDPDQEKAREYENRIIAQRLLRKHFREALREFQIDPDEVGWIDSPALLEIDEKPLQGAPLEIGPSATLDKSARALATAPDSLSKIQQSTDSFALLHEKQPSSLADRPISNQPAPDDFKDLHEENKSTNSARLLGNAAGSEQQSIAPEVEEVAPIGHSVPVVNQERFIDGLATRKTHNPILRFGRNIENPDRPDNDNTATGHGDSLHYSPDAHGRRDYERDYIANQVSEKTDLYKLALEAVQVRYPDTHPKWSEARKRAHYDKLARRLMQDAVFGEESTRPEAAIPEHAEVDHDIYLALPEEDARRVLLVRNLNPDFRRSQRARHDALNIRLSEIARENHRNPRNRLISANMIRRQVDQEDLEEANRVLAAELGDAADLPAYDLVERLRDALVARPRRDRAADSQLNQFNNWLTLWRPSEQLQSLARTPEKHNHDHSPEREAHKYFPPHQELRQRILTEAAREMKVKETREAIHQSQDKTISAEEQDKLAETAGLESGNTKAYAEYLNNVLQQGGPGKLFLLSLQDPYWAESVNRFGDYADKKSSLQMLGNEAKKQREKYEKELEQMGVAVGAYYENAVFNNDGTLKSPEVLRGFVELYDIFPGLADFYNELNPSDEAGIRDLADRHPDSFEAIMAGQLKRKAWVITDTSRATLRQQIAESFNDQIVLGRLSQAWVQIPEAELARRIDQATDKLIEAIAAARKANAEKAKTVEKIRAGRLKSEQEEAKRRAA